MIRVCVVDDHVLVREGVKSVIEDEADMAVVAESDRGEGLVDLCREERVDVLILDVTLPGPGFLQILGRFREELPAVPVLILTVHSEDLFALRAFRAGAAGFLTKDRSPEELALAVRHVHEGGRYVTPSLAEKLVFEIDATGGRLPHESLSDREFQVLRRLARGDSTKKIAHELGLSPKTVSTYRSRVLEKLGLDNNAELVRYSVRHGIVE